MGYSVQLSYEVTLYERELDQKTAGENRRMQNRLKDNKLEVGKSTFRVKWMNSSIDPRV